MRHTKDVEDRLYPTLRADNAEVVIYPWDRKYGALLIGGQGCGKTSALLSFYLNDIEDENAAPIVIDPKSELSRVCLRLTPPDCGKRVWFLDLGRPAFGMSPLRLIGDRPLAIEAAQIADNVVAALLDINENQIYQSSRRYLNHAVIGAIAIATKQGRRARLEDVYSLLRPAKDEFRNAVAEACADQPDLDQTAEFYRSELPDDLRMATSRVAERLDAPRNKISGLTGVPPLRRFFNHPTDVPLREIVQARDILIVDANMGAIGTENSKACMLFILRMLHAQLQRQVHLPEARAPARAAARRRGPLRRQRRERRRPDRHPPRRRPRGRVRAAVLRAARLRLRAPAEDPQGRPQPSAEPVPVPDGRRPGRRAGHQDRDGRLRHDDPRRPRLARPPARHPRAGAELPQLLLPRLLDRERHQGAELHGADVPATRRRRRVGRPPPRRPGRARRPVPRAARVHARDSAGLAVPNRSRSRPTTTRSLQPATPRPSTQPTGPARDGAAFAGSPSQARGAGRLRAARSEGHRSHCTAPCAGSSAGGYKDPIDAQGRRAARPTRYASSRSWIASTRSGPPTNCDGADRLPRLYDEDYTILALLDRVGFAPVSLIARAALPGRAPRTVFDRLVKLYRHGLIARHTTGLHGHSSNDGRPPLLHSLTRRGLQVAQEREPAPGDLPQTRVEADRATPRRPARARPSRARLGDRVPPCRRRSGHRPLAHAALRHRPLPRPPGRPRTTPAPDHAQRDPGRRRAGDHRPRAQDVRGDQARPVARAPRRTAQAHLRPAGRDRPHRPALVQPRQVPRLRRVPLRLEPRPPSLPSPGHSPCGRVRQPGQSRRARLRARCRRAHDRQDRGHGEHAKSLVLRRSRPRVLRGSRPISTTGIWGRSRCRPTRRGYAKGSPEAESSRSTG